MIQALDKIQDIKRLRISSIEPNLLKNETIDFVSNSNSFVPHFHIPLQSGSNLLLKKMRRRYMRELYVDRVQHIKKTMPDACIGVDVIVGFPGETDEQFRETLDLMEAIKFNSAFTFKYSPRPYTKAEQFSDHISEDIKKSRLDEMLILQRKHTLELNQNMVGTFQQVLIEKESKKSNLHWAGRTDSNEWVIIEKNNSNIKDIVPVEISDATGVILHGKEITGA